MKVVRLVRLLSSITLLLCSGISGAAIAATPQIWLSGVDTIVRQRLDPGSTSDFMDLFQPGSPWRTAAASVRVFQVSTQFVTKASDDMLRIVLADLQRRNISLAMAALILSGDGNCGYQVEGYSAPRTMAAAARRIKNLGGNLRYIAMDSPLWFGRFVSRSPRACHSSMETLANDIAAKVNAIRQYFPDVVIGDIEPLGVRQPDDWVEELTTWAEVYRKIVGTPLAFLHADVNWRGPWREQIKPLSDKLHAHGMEFGVICNGFAIDKTPAEWVANADEHVRAVEAIPGLRLDQVVIQTWMRQPDRFLPESQPGTLTNFVLQYLRTR